ncbi:hypothetical protein D3X11_02130 [Streptococcus sp. X16XC17]|uniref:hypothetical protein n=1 Tax=unclassified Streptococcus TaxID=2608887 RepID=UPI00066FDD27|nr:MULTISPECIES: hypothetical protein [unclassified Streptococcus]TCD46264.1 hypothetical protein D3X11_02130 [Streptococcus sp. X16XC17]
MKVRFIDFMKVFFALFLFLKPFYFFSSGTLQIGDICFLLSFSLYLYMVKDSRMELETIDIPLFLFVASVILINSIYFLINTSSDFLVSSIYYIYNLFVIIVFRFLMEEKSIYNLLNRVLKLNLWVQLVAFGVGYGFYAPGRFMGTYNDPNQMGFGIVTTFALLLLLNKVYRVKYLWFYYCLSFYLVLTTNSSGMILSILILLIAYLLNFYEALNIKGNRILYWLSGIVAVFSFTLLVILNFQAVSSEFFELFSRILYKLEGKSLFKAYISDRELFPLLNAPEKILYGAGEGMWARYGRGNEMHATWLSLLFCYGIIPYSLLCTWVYKNIRRSYYSSFVVYLAFFLEGLTLVNHRQPSFWMLFAFGAIVSSKKASENKNLNGNHLE